jgi:hypothetical protein
MADFLDVAERIKGHGGLDASTLDDFRLVFRGLYELQRVQSKAVLDIDNIESVMVAFEMAALFGRLGDLKPEDVQRLPAAVTTLVARTVEESVGFACIDDAIAPAGPYAALTETIKALFSAGQEISVLTFNYDMGADVALVHTGRRPDYRLGGAESPIPTDVPLLKLHGSLSWTKNQHRVYALPIWENAPCPSRHFGERVPLSVLKHLGTLGDGVSGRPFIVPPTWARGTCYDAIAPVWRSAAEELQKAENIYVFGYSLPPYDFFFKLLYGLGTVGQTRLKRFWVFDPDPQVRHRFAGVLGQSAQPRFKFWDKGFSDGLALLTAQLSEEEGFDL